MSACCTSGRTCLPFTTSVLDRASGAFTEHAHLNCYPNTGATWGTGDLVATTHKSYTLASCEAACVSNPRCDAITVEQGAGQEFEWIRNIEAGPPGVRHTLNAGVYLIDRQYQLPPGTHLVGAGSGGGSGSTVIKGVGPAYSSICGADAKNRKGLLLNDHNFVSKLHFVGTDTERYALHPPNMFLCGSAPIETPGCAGGAGYATPPVECGGDTGIGRGVQNATVDDVSVEPFTYQVGFFAAPTRAGVSVTSGLTLRNYRTNGTHADGINLHGAHRDIVVENCTIENSRDDGYGLWSIGTLATNITFRSNTAAKTSGACFAAYGGAFSAFQNNTASDCPRGAVVLFGYGGTNPDVHDTCFGGVFSNTSSTLVAGNHGGGGSRGASRPCLVFNQHCPFMQGTELCGNGSTAGRAI